MSWLQLTTPFLSRPVFSSVLSSLPANPNIPNSSPSPRQPLALTHLLHGGGRLYTAVHKAVQERKRDEAEEYDRKTAPLITPWDSGLWPSSKSR